MHLKFLLSIIVSLTWTPKFLLFSGKSPTWFNFVFLSVFFFTFWVLGHACFSYRPLCHDESSMPNLSIFCCFYLLYSLEFIYVLVFRHHFSLVCLIMHVGMESGSLFASVFCFCFALYSIDYFSVKILWLMTSIVPFPVYERLVSF